MFFGVSLYGVERGEVHGVYRFECVWVVRTNFFEEDGGFLVFSVLGEGVGKDEFMLGGGLGV